MRIAAVTDQVKAAQQRQEQEHRQQFAEFAKRQDDLLNSEIPDLADKDKAAKLQSNALTMLKEIGFRTRSSPARTTGS